MIAVAHRDIEELLNTTKRNRATLTADVRPERLPDGTIWERVQGREWLVTVGDLSSEKVEQIRAHHGVDHVEVNDLGLEGLFIVSVCNMRAPFAHLRRTGL